MNDAFNTNDPTICQMFPLQNRVSFFARVMRRSVKGHRLTGTLAEEGELRVWLAKQTAKRAVYQNESTGP